MSDQEFDWLVLDLVQRGRFQERQASWIATHGSYFLKIPKPGKGVDILSAAGNGGIELARAEYDQLNYLSRRCPQVVRPIALSERYACLVLERLNGGNVREELLRSNHIPPDGILSDCAALLGDLHRSCQGSLDGLTFHDYRNDPYLPYSGTERANNLVVGGFEVRNLIRKPNGAIWFFDPHGLAIGYAEDDFARFLISLLMVSWGLPQPWPWKRFSVSRLISAYEQASGRPIDRALLVYCIERNIAMRNHFARISSRRMPPGLHWIASGYRSLFFIQIALWWRNVRLQILN